MGQHWMEHARGLDRLRRLSKQAEAYRTLSLLLRRPPGRKHTGDVFTCTVACSNARPSSMTSSGRIHEALPLSRRRPVTSRLHSDQRDLDHRRQISSRRTVLCRDPAAINVGLSVSRVGGRLRSRHEVGVWRFEDQPGAVPGTAGLRHVRVRARPGLQASSIAALAHRAAQTIAKLAGARRGAVSPFLPDNGLVDDLAVEDVRPSNWPGQHLRANGPTFWSISALQEMPPPASSKRRYAR